MAEMPIPVGTTQIFNSSTNILLPPAIYTFELYGGQGYGSSSVPGGHGGHSIGSIILAEETRLYLHVGEVGRSTSSQTHADYGGGIGYAPVFGSRTAGGGGSSDIRLRQNNVLNRVIVAGGGGASVSGGQGGDGGGLYGADGQGGAGGQGGTQQAGGAGGIDADAGDTEGTGYGGAGEGNTGTAPSGGGGYHGGGGGNYGVTVTGNPGWGAGGGSGYLYTAETANYPPTGKRLTIADYLFDYEGTGLITEQQQIRTGAGIIYITCQSLIPSAVPIWAKVDGSWRKAEKAYTKIDNTWREIELLKAKKDNVWS